MQGVDEEKYCEEYEKNPYPKRKKFRCANPGNFKEETVVCEKFSHLGQEKYSSDPCYEHPGGNSGEQENGRFSEG